MSSKPEITITKSNDEIDNCDRHDPDSLPVMKITYSVDDKIHRPSCEGPAVYVGKFRYDFDGNIEDIKNGFAVLSGSVKLEISRVYYYHHGEIHRPSNEGPAEIWYDWKNEISQEIYYMNGKKHRPVNEGPAVTDYSLDYSGVKEIAEYYENGKLLRVVRYDVDQNVIEDSVKN